jgi:phosphoglycerate kinase
LKKELEYFSKVLESPERPLLVIMGGAKVKDKITIINNMLDRVNQMIITGGMAFTFQKVCQNINIGNSIFDEEGSKLVPDLVKKAKEKGVKLYFPEDFVISQEFKDGVPTRVVDAKDGIPDGWLGLDVGEKSRKTFHNVITNSKTIFLNGASGVFEFANARQGSVALVNVTLL